MEMAIDSNCLYGGTCIPWLIHHLLHLKLMQVVLVILVITAAISYLAWQFYQRFFKADGKCDGCAVNKASKV